MDSGQTDFQQKTYTYATKWVAGDCGRSSLVVMPGTSSRARVHELNCEGNKKEKFNDSKTIFISTGVLYELPLPTLIAVSNVCVPTTSTYSSTVKVRHHFSQPQESHSG